MDCFLTKTNKAIGQATSWLSLVLVVSTAAIVFMRYGFNISFIWHSELVNFIHAFIFLAGAGYTLQLDGHVRVDVFYQNMTEKKQALVNLLGTVLFLIPTCAALIYFSFDFVKSSWDIYEASNEPGGMPGIFIFKSFMWLYSITLGMQALVIFCNAKSKLKA